MYNKNMLNGGCFFMKKNKYSEEFKLNIVNEYYEGSLGVRLLARKYNLPSKNYITNWIKELKSKGLIPIERSVYRSSGTIRDEKVSAMSKTPYEKELEKKVIRLEAELAVVNEFKKLINKSKKK
jgi:transposase